MALSERSAGKKYTDALRDPSTGDLKGGIIKNKFQNMFLDMILKDCGIPG